MRFVDEAGFFYNKSTAWAGYMDWRAEHWRTLASKGQFSEPTVQEGTTAYAEKQACIVQAMARNFSQKWLPLLGSYSIVPDWPERYTVTTNV